MNTNSLSQSELKALLHYDPETGVWTNRVQRGVRGAIGLETGSVRKQDGYRFIAIKKKYYSAHRLAFLYMEGSLPSDQVDHINHVKDDNRWCNIRHATSTMNNRNSPRNWNNKSGVTGVYWATEKNKWVAEITKKRKKISLGNYKNLLDACCARKSAEIEYGYHPNHGRR